MKRKVVVIRFGCSAPTKSDMIAIVDNLGIDPDSGEILGCPIPMGMASILHTDKSVSEILQAFKQAEESCSDNLPVVVLEESSSVGISLDSMGFEIFKSMMDHYEESFGSTHKGTECTLSLDELLDLVHKVGLEGLSERETCRLKELSK